uniref:ERCC4 domain-containing protein n=1 Tax=viral metagenome TaxID=1070528 RepID=A0A6C0DMG1_9ZZZZ
MRIIIDERETALYEKCIELVSRQTKPTNVKIEKQVLPLGDILFKTNLDKDLLIIERKTYTDLLASIKDGRYEEQSYRLSNALDIHPHSVFYLLEGYLTQVYNPIERKICYSAMTSLQFFKGFSIQRTANVSESAQWILYMAEKIDREFTKGHFPYYFLQSYTNTPKHGAKNVVNSIIDYENNGQGTNQNENVLDNTIIMNDVPGKVLTTANYCSVVKKVKKDNITPDNIGEIILCQIPGISSVTAIAIMKQFSNFPTFIEELNKNPGCLDGIVLESNGKMRKISKAVCDNIRRFLLSSFDDGNQE